MRAFCCQFDYAVRAVEELAGFCPICVHSAASSVMGRVSSDEWLMRYTTRSPVVLEAMSKRTSKRRAKARRSKANHGRKPNAGRNS